MTVATVYFVFPFCYFFFKICSILSMLVGKIALTNGNDDDSSSIQEDFCLIHSLGKSTTTAEVPEYEFKPTISNIRITPPLNQR